MWRSRAGHIVSLRARTHRAARVSVSEGIVSQSIFSEEKTREENMRTVRIFLSIAVLANLARAIWHLYLVVAMRQGTTQLLALASASWPQSSRSAASRS